MIIFQERENWHVRCMWAWREILSLKHVAYCPMLLSLKHVRLYSHPKTGGTSIRQVLEEYSDDIRPHLTKRQRLIAN